MNPVNALKGLFITGTSTGVGKTRIGTLLAKALAQKQIHVIPRKPVESGCDIIDGEELMPADALALMQAADYSGSLTEVCPYRYLPPISPARAARLAHNTLTIDTLARACRSGTESGFVLVEGAGGFYSPLAEDGLNADLAEALGLPILLVAENTLGALNQVLLNAEAIRTRRLELFGVVLNNLHQDQHELMDNAADLGERLHCPIFLQGHGDDTASAELVNAVVQLATEQPSLLHAD